MSYFFDRVNNTQAYRQLLADTRGKKFVAAFGVQPNEKPFIAAGSSNFALYVTSDYVEAQRVFRALQTLTGGNAVYVPSMEDVLLYKNSASHNTMYARNMALRQILDGAQCAVVCVDALLQYFPQRSRFESDCFTLSVGVCYDTQLLARQLVACGFRRVDGITSEGEFVLRGDILDLSMPFGNRFRVDFFDDEVESIRRVSDDGAGEAANDVTVYPLYVVTPFDVNKLPQLGKAVRAQANRLKLSPEAQSRLGEILSDLSIGGADSNWLLPFVDNSPLTDYLPANGTVFLDEPKLLGNRVNFLLGEHAQRVANLTKAGEVLPLHAQSLRTAHAAFDTGLAQISLQTLPYDSEYFHPQAVHNFKTGATSSYAAGEQQLAGDLSRWHKLGYETVIFAGKGGAKPIADKLAQLGVYAVDVPHFSPERGDALVIDDAIERGFVSHTNKLAVVGTRDLGRGMNERSLHKTRKQAFLSVEKGDYVVHDIHGIGLCEGIQKITSGSGEVKDYIVVLYKNGDKLYVPVDATDMLSRYSGGEHPTLSRIGGDDFAKVKSKVKSSIKAMSIDLIKLYAARERARGFRYHIDEYLDEEFGQYFPYKPTEDQVRCHEEITKDLVSDKIMDRLLVGDVGYGKTEVAMRAAFDVASNGYQVAVLAPTTILAEQHYKTFSDRMSHFDIRVRCLNRFRTAEQQKAILSDVKQGKVDILIGTHRLLSGDVVFDKLGLLILDEEQRFGVEHKEKIKSLKTNVDVLTLSATPIPRTLHMALSGIRDISTITTAPVERMAVETFVVEENDALLCDVITREVARGGQVYCVYNRVQSIDSFASRLSDMLPDVKLVVAHGQMGENALEDAVMSFADGNGDVLVCTTIIENGIDIPNVNTIIVIDADKLGLAQLYQLRGRVGRSNRLAYAYFTYQRDKILNETAFKRLSSITEYSELGSGFKIAMKDLEIRGAGNILGKEQHGHMMKVGYDMYARLLKEAVAELKGDKPEQKLTTDVEIDIEAYAPDTYIPLQTDRIGFYQQLAACQSVEEIDRVRAQLADVYGTLPRPTENLFTVARLKLLANKAGICRVTLHPGKGELLFADKQRMMRREVFEALSAAGDRVSALSGSYGVVFKSADFLQKERLIAAMTDFLQAIQT